MTSEARFVFTAGILCAFLLSIAGCGGGSDGPAPSTPLAQDQPATPALDETPPGQESGIIPTESVETVEQSATPVEEVTPDVTSPAESADETPLSPNPTEAVVGGKTLKAQLCSIEGKSFLGEDSMNLLKSIEVVGDKLMVADQEGKLHGFVIGDGGLKLTVDVSFGERGVLTLDDQVGHLSSDDAGRVVASGVFKNGFVIRDGKAEFACGTRGNVEMHSSGTWGLVYEHSGTSIADFAGNACTVKDFTVPASEGERFFQGIHSATIIGDQILIGGGVKSQEVDKTVQVVVAFDRTAAEKFRFGNATDVFATDGIAWVHAIDSCATGICVLDSNFRKLTLWTGEGEFVGTTRLGNLFDLQYPWISDFTVADDGSAYFLALQKRQDSEITEGLIYRVTGL